MASENEDVNVYTRCVMPLGVVNRNNRKYSEEVVQTALGGLNGQPVPVRLGMPRERRPEEAPEIHLDDIQGFAYLSIKDHCLVSELRIQKATEAGKIICKGLDDGTLVPAPFGTVYQDGPQVRHLCREPHRLPGGPLLRQLGQHVHAPRDYTLGNAQEGGEVMEAPIQMPEGLDRDGQIAWLGKTIETLSSKRSTLVEERCSERLAEMKERFEGKWFRIHEHTYENVDTLQTAIPGAGWYVKVRDVRSANDSQLLMRFESKVYFNTYSPKEHVFRVLNDPDTEIVMLDEIKRWWSDPLPASTVAEFIKNKLAHAKTVAKNLPEEVRPNL